MIVSLIMLICSFILILMAILILHHAFSIEIQRKHEQQQINQINQQIEKLQLEKQNKKQQLQFITKDIKNKEEQLENHYQIGIQLTNNKIEEYKKVVSQAANNYIDTLQKDYEDAEAVHKKKITSLQTEYNKTAAALNNLKETRKIAYERVLKQQEVKDNKDNYRLIPSSQDLHDVHILENIKPNLNKQRILSMLIWQSVWQPIAKKQFPIILQDKTKTGIYRITNIQTDECYIGQAIDVYKRWCQHCKAGLGIDTPTGNKLYKAIQNYGLQNFTFELICECPKEQLNEKENYFIELYQSNLYGYNGNVGVKK